MSLRKTIEVLVRLAEKGAIESYAITGAIAALNYIQPTLTEDLDILVSVAHFEKRPSGLILLTPIEKALAELGYAKHSDLGYMIEGWPVQFIPVASALDEEALERAIELEVNDTGDPPVKARCLRAEHIIAIALVLGRFKDFDRVESFLKQGVVDNAALKDVLQRHGLMDAWVRFCGNAGIEDPLLTS